MQLGLHVGPEKLYQGWEAIPKAVACLRDMFFSLGCLVSWRGSASLAKTLCAKVKGYPGRSLPHQKRREGGMAEKDCGRETIGEGSEWDIK